MRNGTIKCCRIQDLLEVSDNFKCNFYNAGVEKGGIYNVKVKPDYVCISIKEYKEENKVDEKYFLTESQIEKFAYLKVVNVFLELSQMENHITMPKGYAFSSNLDSPC